jgi:hypothetical protein
LVCLPALGENAAVARTKDRPMLDGASLTGSSLRTPKAAALAGIAFSIMIGLVFWLFRISIPADPLDSGAWLARSSSTVTLALNLMPFVGIAFLWFIGVLRDRLGQREDRLFSTVFSGSALLFLAMLFSSAAVIGAIMLAASAEPAAMINSATLLVARALAYNLVNVYAIKMAGVFMISASTMILYARIAPRWIAFVGYALALILLLGSYYINWGFVVLPVWVLLISIHILIDNYRSPTPQQRDKPGVLLQR